MNEILHVKTKEIFAFIVNLDNTCIPSTLQIKTIELGSNDVTFDPALRWRTCQCTCFEGKGNIVGPEHLETPKVLCINLLVT